MQWELFVKACPEISEVARARFARDQLVMVGTLRRDGWPRVSPCEIDIAAGHLFFGMMWQSTKALDLIREPRFNFHTVNVDRPGTGGRYGASAAPLQTPTIFSPPFLAPDPAPKEITDSAFHLADGLNDALVGTLVGSCHQIEFARSTKRRRRSQQRGWQGHPYCQQDCNSSRHHRLRLPRSPRWVRAPAGHALRTRPQDRREQTSRPQSDASRRSERVDGAPSYSRGTSGD